jgi:nucleoporin POM152
VKLAGSSPFKLTYEIVHDGSKRTEYAIKDIESDSVEIASPPFKSGGKYTIALVTVQDSNGCKTSLNAPEAIVEVRRQRPTAGFLSIDGSMNVKVLEGENIGLPLRLSGEGPWNVTYKYTATQNTSTKESIVEETTIGIDRPNGGLINVNREGQYTLSGVHDAYCPGEVKKSEVFHVNWFAKPGMSIVNTPAMSSIGNNVFERKAICEGDEDAIELSLKGKCKT